METNKTIGCPICNCFPNPNTLKKFTQSLGDSERKCPACGKNCGKPALLDLFCGAGGASRGYQEAGFCVLGVDIKPQPRYIGCGFHQGDALEYCAAHGAEFDVIHASPPCQAYTGMRAITIARFGSAPDHPDLIDATRRVLKNAGGVWIIENVQNSPLDTHIILCGTSLGLPELARHRHFESSVLLFAPPCSHKKAPFTIGVYGARPDGRRISYRKYRLSRAAKGLPEAQRVMGIEWMTWDEIKLAIPPAYTEYIGRQLLEAL